MQCSYTSIYVSTLILNYINTTIFFVIVIEFIAQITFLHHSIIIIVCNDSKSDNGRISLTSQTNVLFDSCKMLIFAKIVYISNLYKSFTPLIDLGLRSMPNLKQ